MYLYVLGLLGVAAENLGSWQIICSPRLEAGGIVYTRVTFSYILVLQSTEYSKLLPLHTCLAMHPVSSSILRGILASNAVSE